MEAEAAEDRRGHHRAVAEREDERKRERLSEEASPTAGRRFTRA